MADTWAGNSWNQLVTLKALRDACSYLYGYSTLPPDSREIATIGDLSTYGITYGNYAQATARYTSVYNTLSSPNNNQCVTKNLLDVGAYFTTPQTTFACNYNTGLELLYSSGTSGIFTVGCQLYTNRARTTAKTFSAKGYITVNNNTYYEVSTAGVILSVSTPC